jgi:hypothetical protein
MSLLTRELSDARDDERCIPSDEFDVLIGGDFNANRYRGPAEDFWNLTGWRTLSPTNGANYSATRMSSVPLAFGRSQIDYLMVTDATNHGLDGEEIAGGDATVHFDLAGSDLEGFRGFASDHVPVTILVRVMADTDGQ